jgi:pilus assembly protein Flp/PilA
MQALKNFVAREDGQDLVEYALLAALLSIVSIATLQILGPKIAAVWTTISGKL